MKNLILILSMVGFFGFNNAIANTVIGGGKIKYAKTAKTPEKREKERKKSLKAKYKAYNATEKYQAKKDGQKNDLRSGDIKSNRKAYGLSAGQKRKNNPSASNKTVNKKKNSVMTSNHRLTYS